MLDKAASVLGKRILEKCSAAVAGTRDKITHYNAPIWREPSNNG